MAVRLSALRAGSSSAPRKIPSAHFCWRLSRPQGHSEGGRIRSIDIFNYLFGNRTRNLLSCSTVPQPTIHTRDNIFKPPKAVFIQSLRKRLYFLLRCYIFPSILQFFKILGEEEMRRLPAPTAPMCLNLLFQLTHPLVYSGIHVTHFRGEWIFVWNCILSFTVLTRNVILRLFHFKNVFSPCTETAVQKKCWPAWQYITRLHILQNAAFVRTLSQISHPNSFWTELNWTELNSVVLVRKRTIRTERPQPVGEVSANFSW
jgi:hypothetical protein